MRYKSQTAESGEREENMLALKFVVPKMKETFGELIFAGAGDVTTQRNNGRINVVSRTYHLFSDVQRADDIEVRLPASAGEKHFEYEDVVTLINPRITAEGYSIGDRGYTNYILTADDMVKADEAPKA